MKALRLLGLAAAGLAVALAIDAMAVRPPALYFEADQRVYLEMARSQPFSGAIDVAPYCWRVLLPILVHVTPGDSIVAFRMWMLLALTVLPPLAAVFLRAAGIGDGAATVAGLLMAFSPAVAGYLSWDFIRPDGLSLLLMFTTALCFVKAWRAGFLIGIGVLALTRETWTIVIVFTLMWSFAMPAGAFRLSVVGGMLGLAVAVSVRLLVPPSEPYSLLAHARGLYWPFSAAVVLRRAMMAVGSTWNVLGPLAAYAIARRVGQAKAWALAAAVALAIGQIAFAMDTQRIVAAAYPFVLLACAWDLDRLDRRQLYVAGAALVAAQLPWLLAYGRILPLSLRAADIVLSLATVAAAVAGLVHSAREDGGRRVEDGFREA